MLLLCFCFLDEVGCDISYHVNQFMSKADLGVRMEGGNPGMMAKMVEKGWLGRKAGKGFYLYPKNPKKGEKKQLNPEVVGELEKLMKESGVTKSKLAMDDIQFRIISRFINEAAFCLQDEIIRAPADGKFRDFIHFICFRQSTRACVLCSVLSYPRRVVCALKANSHLTFIFPSSINY